MAMARAIEIDAAGWVGFELNVTLEVGMAGIELELSVILDKGGSGAIVCLRITCVQVGRAAPGQRA